MPDHYSKSIDFLLENAGPVIRYRLKKEILGDLTEDEEERLLNEICGLPLFRLLASYVKPDGWIGSGMHSWDNWRGQVLHKMPLQDGECAVRLLAYYRIPKSHPFVQGFVSAMRDEEILRKEFSYIPPEIPRFENRFEGLNNGNCPYIEADEYFPDYYTLSMLAYTRSWRSAETVGMLADAFNHINAVMKPDHTMAVRVKGKYYGPCFALIHPIRAFHPDLIDSIAYRRMLTEIAMLDVGGRVGVLRETAANIEEAMAEDGILRMNPRDPRSRRCLPTNISYPTAYADAWLEPNYKNKTALLCDLTFWAVEFLHLLEKAEK